MRTLVVGIGALGGLISARLQASGAAVWLATRNEESAALLKAAGLHVSGIGGNVSVTPDHVAAIDTYSDGEPFDLVVLATKAKEAVELAPQLARMIRPGGTLLPIQNGGVATLISDSLGGSIVLGGLSNLGATMSAPGVCEQRNAGHLLIGELAGGPSERAQAVRDWLGRAVEVRVTANVRGTVWSKLLLNCSVTTVGAIAGGTMRSYIGTPEGREVFHHAYDEALAVALASGATPERMIVEPLPPGWNGHSQPGPGHDAWLEEVLKGYGDLKPSMLQDFERGRVTEIDYLNGYVVDVGRRHSVATPMNAAIVETVRAITAGKVSPDRSVIRRLALATR